MPRRPKPWYRKAEDGWYVQHNRRQVRLADGKDGENAAWDAYHKLMASDAAVPPSKLHVATVLELFLDHAEKHCRPATYDWYRFFLKRFAKVSGKLTVDKLKVHTVTNWLASQKWKEGSRRAAVMCVKRAFKWAADQDYIADSPVRKLKTPPGRPRERFLTEAERAAIRAEYRPTDPWLDFLTALEESGARPGEIARVTAAHVDLNAGLWRFSADEHKTGRKVRKPRLIMLTPTLLGLTAALMRKRPEGPLFRNRDGRPWHRNAVRCRFRRIRAKLNLGNDVCAYLFRHAYVTDALTNGVPVASVAELVGHQDTSMIARHYSKLSQQQDHLRAMANKARPGA